MKHATSLWALAFMLGTSVLLMALKGLGFISWGWGAILSPIWVPFLIGFILTFITVMRNKTTE